MKRDKTFGIYVPSYKRYDCIKTDKVLNDCTYVVRESEEQLYRDAGVRKILAAPDQEIDSLPKIRQWIIDHTPEDIIVQIDDDIERFSYVNKVNMEEIPDIEHKRREVGKLLTLTIEKKWFDMILSGEKTEEYRELKRYYDSRFRNAAMLKNQEYQASVSEFRNLAATVDQDIGTVKFRNGYTTDAPCFLADCKLTVGEGKPEWGAVPGTEYYILKMKNVRRK